MKKTIFTSLVIALVLLMSPVSGYGYGGGHGFSGGLGPVGGHGFGARPGFGGGHGFDGRHGFVAGRGFGGGHGFVRGYGYGGGLWIGPGWGPWYRGSHSYWGVPYPDYEVPVIVEQPSPVYVEPTPQAPGQYYWYYCENSRAYYPYVKECSDNWEKVAPSPPAPNQ